MPVDIYLRCDGCVAAMPVRAGKIRQHFVSVSGRPYGIGGMHQVVHLQPPDGWWAFDPWTNCTYCPTCRAGIEAHQMDPTR